MTSLATLEEHLAGSGRVLLGYSGGVDSALIAVVARRAIPAGDFLAVIGRSDAYPAVQHVAALAVARQFDVPVFELQTGELDDPRYRANPTNRCYYCKQELWSRLRELADARGFSTIIDGTNADDLGEHRPGMGAAGERGVRSPLAELGWTKPMVRTAARVLGIAAWDAPASPCLASRIQYGLPVTRERLGQVERAEALLRDHGITGDLRVRHHGDHASVEVAVEQVEHVAAGWESLSRQLRALDFPRVELDPRGYRRGSLLVQLTAAPAAAEAIAS